MAEPRPSLWRRILERLEETRANLRALFDPKPPTDTVAFSIAFIALAAKLAKADGLVTRDEVAMFRRIFEIPPEEEANAARVYNLCRQETTGFEAYARRMARAVRRVPEGSTVLADVLDGLFHIAMADGEFHPAEERFLQRVTEIFGLDASVYERMKCRHVPGMRDPYAVLGVDRAADEAEIRAARRRYLAENHPDRLIAQGLPTEMVQLANARVADMNVAYEEILAARQGGTA